jgi:cytochrome b561
MKSTADPRYDGVAKLLHWLIVVLITAQFLLGWLMPGVHKGTQPVGLISWHLSVGTAIVFVMVVRLLWRLTHPAPPPPATLPGWMQSASSLTHGLLYLVLLVLPLLGWVSASQRGWPVKLFGAIDLPPLSATGSKFGHQVGDLHSPTAWVLLALIGLHVAAAMFHHFVLRDNLLQRMLPGR